MASPTLFRQPNSILQSLTYTLTRTFTSTAPTCGRPSSRLPPDRSDATLPPYPHGPAQYYKQADLGLYGGAKKRFGNMVGEKNEIKTRRHWQPNVTRKFLFSKALNTNLRLRVTPRVIRTIDKVGGLDEYVLGGKASRIKELGMEGWRLRWRIMQTDEVKERFRGEMLDMGMHPDDLELTRGWVKKSVVVKSDVAKSGEKGKRAKKQYRDSMGEEEVRWKTVDLY